MDADWVVACGADDPVVVVPWGGDVRDLTTGRPIQYVDLRSTPDAIRDIPEAVDDPDLGVALCCLNRPDTPFFTAKCDAWNYPGKYFDAEDLPGFAWAHASYIDLVPLEPRIFSSFAAWQRLLRTLTETGRSIQVPASRCEWVLRPARILAPASRHSVQVGAGLFPLDGFATSLYVWGYGDTTGSATSAWSHALLALVEQIATHPEHWASKL